MKFCFCTGHIFVLFMLIIFCIDSTSRWVRQSVTPPLVHVCALKIKGPKFRDKCVIHTYTEDLDPGFYHIFHKIIALIYTYTNRLTSMYIIYQLEVYRSSGKLIVIKLETFIERVGSWSLCHASARARALVCNIGYNAIY